MTLEKQTEVGAAIERVGNVILNRQRTLEDVISAGVVLTNLLADLEYDTDITRAALCVKAENREKSVSALGNLWKNKTIAERRLFNIGRGFRKTLRNIEYAMNKNIT